MFCQQVSAKNSTKLCHESARASCARQQAVPGFSNDTGVTSSRPPLLAPRHARYLQHNTSMSCHSVQRGQPLSSSTSNLMQFVQGAELVSISIAAAYQAAVILRWALQLTPPHDYTRDITQQTHNRLSALQAQQLEQQHHTQSQQTHIVQPDSRNSNAVVHQAAPVLPGLQSVAILLALICGVAIRYLQRPRLPAGVLSADAAARLVAVEFVSQQQSAHITDMARQLDKLQTRVRLSTRDMKLPLRQAQGGAVQAAAALTKLSEQQQHLQKQLDGSQELIAALQGLAAKQFQVSAEALQQLKAGQAQLSSSVSTAMADVQKQQQALQQQLERQQLQIARLEGQDNVDRHHRRQQQHDGIPHNGSSRSSTDGVMPDPWVQQSPTAQHNGAARSFQ